MIEEDAEIPKLHTLREQSVPVSIFQNYQSTGISKSMVSLKAETSQ